MSNKSKLIIALALCSLVIVLFCAPTTQAQLSDDTLGKPTTSLSRVYPLQTISVANNTASTSAVAITAQTGRAFIGIYPSVNALSSAEGTKELHVGIGTSTISTTTGICVTSRRPLELWLDDGVAVYTIASEAFGFMVVQGKY